MGGYVMIPLMVTLTIKSLKIKWVFISYFITFLLVLIYPVFQNMANVYYGPIDGPADCVVGYDSVGIYPRNFAIHVTLAIQFLFNYGFLNAYFIKKEKAA